MQMHHEPAPCRAEALRRSGQHCQRWLSRGNG